MPRVVLNPARDLDENTSLWQATAAPREALPPLAGDITADVIIIGAGFTGISTGYHLARRYPDRHIVVLEARQVGNGASGRSGGMALNWINGVHADTPERARRVYGATKAGLDWIASVIAEHGLNVRFNRIGCLDTYTNNQRAEEAHESAEKLAAWGIPVQYLQGSALESRVRARGVVGAVNDPTTGQLHGLDLLRGLVPILQGYGVRICENSPVVAIEEGKTHVVRTPNGSVRAPTLVLATNAYTARLGYFTRGVFPLHSHVIATDPLPLERWRELGWGDTAGFCDDLDRIAYASMSADGRLLIGGGCLRLHAASTGSSGNNLTRMPAKHPTRGLWQSMIGVAFGCSGGGSSGVRACNARARPRRAAELPVRIRCEPLLRVRAALHCAKKAMQARTRLRRSMTRRSCGCTNGPTGPSLATRVAVLAA